MVGAYVNLSRRDFEAIAFILQQAKIDQDLGFLVTADDMWSRIQGNLTDYFADNTPRFDIDKFKQACY